MPSGARPKSLGMGHRLAVLVGGPSSRRQGAEDGTRRRTPQDSGHAIDPHLDRKVDDHLKCIKNSV